MTFLDGLSFQVKLLLILLIPLGGIFGLGIVGIHEKRTLIVQMEQMNRLSGLTLQVSDLVHEIQRERGMSAGLIGSRGQQFQEELATQRGRTDDAYRRLTALRATIHHTRQLKVDLDGYFLSAEAQFQRLTLIRGRVDHREISSADAI
ncbi:MAG: nitrate- and nitrite sensing domain-containing protein, partial [Magnetococcales bacterium]|nr:nitrate- and nitrite sensing domain-containing protein [Magnetococcales bacterium]